MVTAGKKHAILLSVCGAHTYHLIDNLTTPVTPLQKSYVDVMDLVREHYSPRRSETIQRFKFNSHTRKQEEAYKRGYF